MLWLRHKRHGKPVGIWIACVLVALFLVRSLALPVVLNMTNFLGGPSPLKTIALSIALVHFFIGTPVALVALVGILKRRIWGMVMGFITCILFFLFPLMLVVMTTLIAAEAPWMIAPGDLPSLVIVGTAMSGIFALVGVISLMTNRRWFDDYLVL